MPTHLLRRLALFAAVVTGGASSADDARPRLDSYVDALPAGATARLGSLRFRMPFHSRLSCALSPDGRTLATGEDGRARLWETATGRPLLTVPLSDYGLTSFSFSPDGRRLLVCVDGSVVATSSGHDRIHVALYVVDVAAGKLVARHQPPGRPLPVGISADGKLLFLWDFEDLKGGTIVMDAATGAVLRRVPGLRGGLTPDSAVVVEWNVPERIRFLDSTTGKLLRETEYKGGTPYQVAFSPDGKSFAARHLPADGAFVETFKSPIRIWDVATGKERAVFEYEGSAYTPLSFSPDGRLLTLWPDQLNDARPALLAWEAATGRAVLRAPLPKRPRDTGPVFYRPLFSGDGKTMYWRESAEFVGSWETTGGKEPGRWKAPVPVDDVVAVTPDGTGLILRRGGSLIVCDAATGRHRPATAGHTQWLRSLVFAPDGKSLASLEGAGTLRLWDVAAGTPRLLGDGEEAANVVKVRFTPDGRTLAAVGINGPELGGNTFVSGWKLEAGAPARRVFTRKVPLGGTVLLAPDGRTAAMVNDGDGGTLEVVETATGRSAFQVKAHEGKVWQHGYLAAGRLVATRGEDDHLCLWDVETGKRRLRLAWPRLIGGGVAFTDDGKTMALWRERGKLELWDFAADRLVWSQPVGARQLHGPPVFSADGKTFGLIHGIPFEVHAAVWDSATGKELAGPEGAGEVRGDYLARGPGGELLAVTRVRPRQDAEERPDAPAPQAEDVLRTVPSGRVVARISARPEGVPPNIIPGVRFLSFGEVEPMDLARPAGPSFAALRGDTVAWWDLARGRETARLPRGHERGVTTLALTPDGRTLATGGTDGTILLWDVSGLKGDSPRLVTYTAAELDALWPRLTEPASRWDGAGLLASPSQAVTLLGERLRAVKGPDPADVRRLIVALNHEDFEKREAASRELAALGAWVKADLAKALAAAAAPEAKRRLTELVRGDRAAERRDEDLQRAVAGLRVLELIATAEARKVLEEVARGPAESPLTAEAKTVLERLSR